MFALISFFLIALTVASGLGRFPAGSHRALPLFFTPWIFIPVLVGCLVLIAVLVRFVRRSWAKVLAGSIPRGSSLAKMLDADFRRRSGRSLWTESDWEGASSPRSDLSRALVFMRIGSYLASSWVTLLIAVFFGVLFFGGMSVLILTPTLDAYLPQVRTFSPTFVVGSLLVLALAFWILIRGILDGVTLEREFTPIANADLWLEQQFWGRF